MKNKFKEKVAEVIEKYEDKLPYLNALIMWTYNPTSPSAGYGFEENIPFIEKNISLMFRDENAESVANTTYLEIIDLAEAYKQLHDVDHRDPVYMTYDEILKQIYSKYSSSLVSQIYQAIEKTKDTRVLELSISFKEFLKKENLLRFRPTISEKRFELGEISIDTHFIKSNYRKRTNHDSPSLDLLISVGLLYEMYYQSGSGKTKEAFYFLPPHVPEALANYDFTQVKFPVDIQQHVSSIEVPVHADDLFLPNKAGFQSTIIWKGEVRKATHTLASLFENDGRPICIVDNYFDYRTLEIINDAVAMFDLDPQIEFRILTHDIGYRHDTLRAYRKVLSVVPNILVRWINHPYDNPFHDRYVLTKNAGVHIGTSIKDLGWKRISVISKLCDRDKEILLENFNRIWNEVALTFPEEFLRYYRR